MVGRERVVEEGRKGRRGGSELRAVLNRSSRGEAARSSFSAQRREVFLEVKKRGGRGLGGEYFLVANQKKDRETRP